MKNYLKQLEDFKKTIDNMPKSELLVKHGEDTVEFRAITPDGWVVSDKNACGDHGEDCQIIWRQKDFLKEKQKEHKLTKQMMSWILWVSRPTYDKMLQEDTELTHRQYLTLQSILDFN